MKKIFIYLFLCCLLISSCNKVNNVDSANKGESININNEGEFRGIVSDRVININDINEGVTEYKLDEDAALMIADIILKKVYGEEIIENTTFIVSEIKGEGFFVISRIPKTNVPGFDYNIAINKKDGKILRIWMGE